MPLIIVWQVEIHQTNLVVVVWRYNCSALPSNYKSIHHPMTIITVMLTLGMRMNVMTGGDYHAVAKQE